MNIPNSVELIDRHLTKFFDDSEILVLDEIESKVIHSDVYIIKPTDDRPFYVLLTCGLSSLPMSIPENIDADEFIEVLMLLPSNWKMNYDDFNDENNYWPVRILKELSKYPHLNKTWLGYGHTYTHEDFLSSDNKFFGVILLNSMTLSKEFTHITDDEKKVRFYTVVPIYREELEFKQKNGTSALLEKFEEFGIEEIVNVGRRNVCL